MNQPDVEHELLVQLFVAGDSEQTSQVRDRVVQFAETMLKQPNRVEVVDVFEHPDLADIARVLVTPTLIIHRGKKQRRLVGDLSDSSKLQLVLTDSLPD